MNKKTIKDIDLKNKKVLVRCDFNVPMDEEKNITDNTRIVAALPTIKYLLENNCKIIYFKKIYNKGQIRKLPKEKYKSFIREFINEGKR